MSAAAVRHLRRRGHVGRNEGDDGSYHARPRPARVAVDHVALRLALVKSACRGWLVRYAASARSQLRRAHALPRRVARSTRSPHPAREILPGEALAAEMRRLLDPTAADRRRDTLTPAIVDERCWTPGTPRARAVADATPSRRPTRTPPRYAAGTPAPTSERTTSSSTSTAASPAMRREDDPRQRVGARVRLRDRRPSVARRRARARYGRTGRHGQTNGAPCPPPRTRASTATTAQVEGVRSGPPGGRSVPQVGGEETSTPQDGRRPPTQASTDLAQRGGRLAGGHAGDSRHVAIVRASSSARHAAEGERAVRLRAVDSRCVTATRHGFALFGVAVSTK